MIHIIKGNLLDAPQDLIGHQVNCQGVMGSGVARQIRDKWPVVYERYVSFCKQMSSPWMLLGQYQHVSVGENKRVANLFGQNHYGRDKSIVYTDYVALFQAIRTLKFQAQNADRSIALPYNIGCGFANGDWNVVYPVLEQIFADYELFLYKFEG